MIITNLGTLTFKWRRELPWARGTRGGVLKYQLHLFLELNRHKMFNCYHSLAFCRHFSICFMNHMKHMCIKKVMKQTEKCLNILRKMTQIKIHLSKAKTCLKFLCQFTWCWAGLKAPLGFSITSPLESQFSRDKFGGQESFVCLDADNQGKRTHFQNSTPAAHRAGKNFQRGAGEGIGGRRLLCRDSTVSFVIWKVVWNSEHHLV